MTIWMFMIIWCFCFNDSFFFLDHIDCWPVLCFMCWLLAWMMVFIKTRIYTCTTKWVTNRLLYMFVLERSFVFTWCTKYSLVLMIFAFDLYSLFYMFCFNFMYMYILSKLSSIHIHPWATYLHAYTFFVDSLCLGYVCIL